MILKNVCFNLERNEREDGVEAHVYPSFVSASAQPWQRCLLPLHVEGGCTKARLQDRRRIIINDTLHHDTIGWTWRHHNYQVLDNLFTTQILVPLKLTIWVPESVTEGGSTFQDLTGDVQPFDLSWRETRTEHGVEIYPTSVPQVGCLDDRAGPSSLPHRVW